jgi:hypothetical protein
MHVTGKNSKATARKRPFGPETGRSTYAGMVQLFLHYLTPIAMGAVACVLLAGLINMMRGGSSNRSQVLMRWRVVLQFTAVVVMMTALYLHSH